MTGPHHELPVTVDITPGEDIAGYLDRVAAANHSTMVELTGHRRDARTWEDPPPDLLGRVSATTGANPAALKAATLSRAFPAAVLERARTGRRYAGQPATCPQGCVESVAARLNIVVLCPTCGELLVDRFDPNPPPVPSRVFQIHPEVMTALHRARRSPRTRDRLRRVESLMAELEPALWDNWPPLAPGETAQWRRRIVRWEKVVILERQSTAARPPGVSATLLALTWDASADPARTTSMLDDIAVMADPWEPDPGALPDWRTAPEARDCLLDLLEDLGIEPRHVPSILRFPDEPIILTEHQRTLRTAEAIALTVLAGQARGQHLTIAAAAGLHAVSPSPRTRRVAARILQGVYGMRRLSVHARLLHGRGLRDVAHARAQLRGVRSLPATALRDLIIAHPLNPEVVAAWVWLDATAGRPAGGPHPHRYPADVLDLDAALDPESRLHLRQWWRHHLSATEDLITDGAVTPHQPTQSSRDAG